MAEDRKKIAVPGLRCRTENLAGAAPGLWRYAHENLAEKTAREPGFFAEAFARYGMKEGDVVVVNAGRGAAYVVGV